MFKITYEDKFYRQWDREYLFNNFDDAKKYLLDSSFIEKNRLFIREYYN
jgi:hypothetical protein